MKCTGCHKLQNMDRMWRRPESPAHHFAALTSRPPEELISISLLFMPDPLKCCIWWMHPSYASQSSTLIDNGSFPVLLTGALRILVGCCFHSAMKSSFENGCDFITLMHQFLNDHVQKSGKERPTLSNLNTYFHAIMITSPPTDLIIIIRVFFFRLFHSGVATANQLPPPNPIFCILFPHANYLQVHFH